MATSQYPSEDSMASLKILLIGSSNVGKSALLTRYCDNVFEPENAATTIGIDYKIKKLSVHGTPYRVMLFDTAGQERFRTLSTSYYRGAHGVILVYDVSNRASFASMDRWFDEAETNTVPGVVMYLVGAKLDKASAESGSGRAVSTEEGEALARSRDALFCEASARTGENVRKPFLEVIGRVAADKELQRAAGGGGLRPRGVPVALVGKGNVSGAAAGGVSVNGYGYGCSC